jgi:hypothetical protein
VVERLFATARGLDEDAEIALVVLLTDVFVERGWPKESVETSILRLLASGDGSRVRVDCGAYATRGMLRLTLGSRRGFLHG